MTLECEHGHLRRKCNICCLEQENAALRQAVSKLVVAVAKAGAPLEALLMAHKGSGRWDDHLAREVQDGIHEGVTAARNVLARWREYVDE